MTAQALSELELVREFALTLRLGARRADRENAPVVIAFGATGLGGNFENTVYRCCPGGLIVISNVLGRDALKGGSVDIGAYN